MKFFLGGAFIAAAAYLASHNAHADTVVFRGIGKGLIISGDGVPAAKFYVIDENGNIKSPEGLQYRSCAGILMYPASQTIDALKEQLWQRYLYTNREIEKMLPSLNEAVNQAVIACSPSVPGVS
jgi:hypothetical protein